MGLSTEQMVELGLSLPTNTLVEWANCVKSVGLRERERLTRRGVNEPLLRRIDALVREVQDLSSSLDGNGDLPRATAERVREIMEDANDFCEEVEALVKVEFGTDPEVLARFRPGIRTGGLIANMSSLIRCRTGLLREYRAQLGWLGVNDEFIRRGVELVERLNEAAVSIDTTRRSLAKRGIDLNVGKGELYDLTRKLVRIGRLEFRNEPDLLNPFNYDILRKEKASVGRAKTKGVLVSR